MFKIPTRIANRLIALSSFNKQILMLSADAFLLLLAAFLAYTLRLGHWFVPNLAQSLLIIAAPLLALPLFFRMGLYRSVIRYLGEQTLWSIIKSMSIATLLWTVLAFMTHMNGAQGMPRTVPLLYGLIGTMFIIGLRFAARSLLRLPMRARLTGKPILIYGAGEAGRQLAASLRGGQELFLIGFIDDDVALCHKDVDGLHVYPPSELSTLIEQFTIRDVIVTLPSASSQTRRTVVTFLEQHALRVRILPALTDIASGRHLVNLVREVDIGDLLGRDPVAADPNLLGQCIVGKVVMVSGAGGSIGSELCRQIAAIGPTCIILLEMSEHALYQIERTLSTIANCPVIPCLGSVKNTNLVSSLLEKYHIQTIYHAAAHKHVPLVEANILEGVSNNVFGTFALAQAAFTAHVETFVLISTDKAVRPTNIMGATKRLAELIVQDFAEQAHLAGRHQRFCAVRFGNVLGSSGSVIPLFKEQITQGGPVTVTHAEVTRYFMSIHEAVELVIQASSLGSVGDIFLLDMGEPVKIIDLARNMIHLAGHSVRDEAHPDGDIEIAIIGLRPGEKLYEELLIASDQAETTLHPKIMKAKEPGLNTNELAALLSRLNTAIEKRDEVAIREALMG